MSTAIRMRDLGNHRAGPRRERDMIVKRLSWRGFVVVDHAHLYPRAPQQLQQLFVAGGLI